MAAGSSEYRLQHFRKILSDSARVARIQHLGVSKARRPCAARWETSFGSSRVRSRSEDRCSSVRYQQALFGVPGTGKAGKLSVLAPSRQQSCTQLLKATVRSIRRDPLHLEPRCLTSSTVQYSCDLHGTAWPKRCNKTACRLRWQNAGSLKFLSSHALELQKGPHPPAVRTLFQPEPWTRSPPSTLAAKH